MTDPILREAEQGDLDASVQENLYALFRSMRFLPGYEALETERLCFHHAFLDNAMFRGVWRARLEKSDLADAVNEALGWFERRGAPDMYWWIDPLTQPEGLAAYLLQRGFDGNLKGSPAMTLDMNLHEPDPKLPQGVKIVQALDRETLKDWSRVFTTAFEVPVTDGQSWVEAAFSVGVENAPWQYYVAYLDGKASATSLLFKGAGVAGIYAVGTLPEARGKGIGAAVTLKALLEARSQGYRYGVLFSSQMGYRVYQRLGFRDSGSTIGVYVYEWDTPE